MRPEVLLMDEPTSALDPIASSKIEGACPCIKKRLTIITVTHNMLQAAEECQTIQLSCPLERLLSMVRQVKYSRLLKKS